MTYLVPGCIYILEGELTVEFEDGHQLHFKARGSVRIAEVTSTFGLERYRIGSPALVVVSLETMVIVN